MLVFILIFGSDLKQQWLNEYYVIAPYSPFLLGECSAILTTST